MGRNKFYRLGLLALFFTVITGSASAGTFIGNGYYAASGAFSLYGSGGSPDGDPWNRDGTAWGRIYGDLRIDDTFSSSTEQRSGVGEWIQRGDEYEVLKFTEILSRVSLLHSKGNHTIGLAISHELTGNYVDPGSGTWSASSSAFVTHSNAVQLVYRGQGEVPIVEGRDLRFKFDIHANYVQGEAGGSVALQLAVLDQPYVFNGSTPYYSAFSRTPRVFDPSVNLSVRIDENREAKYDIGFGVNFTTSGLGSSLFDATNTVRLSSITFEDGTTPEELGFEVVFASGAQSPNLAFPLPAAVPEPSTFAIWSLLGLCGVGLCIHREVTRAT